MGWKKALFFGGAVLVLAACSDSSTAPTALRQADAPPAAFTLSAPTTTSTGTVTLPPKPVIDPICTGIVIRTGVTTEITEPTEPTSCSGSW
jgi:hypothetical protein